MTRSYDTGLAAPQRSLIRAAIAQRLAPLLKANGGYLRKIGSLPRPLRNDSENELGMLAWALDDQTPAILIALGRKNTTPTSTDGLEWSGAIDIAIYAISSNARGYVDGRLAADVAATTDLTADPGVEVMLEQIAQLLLGQSLGIDTTLELREASEDEVWTEAALTVWEQRYTANVTIEINPYRAVTQRITSIEVHTNLAGAELVNPLVKTITELEDPSP